MQRSSIYLALSLLALLGLTTYVVQRPAERGIQRLRFAKVAYSHIDRIDLSGAHRAALHKEGDVWKLSSGRDADTGMVERLVELLTEVDSTDWLTDQPEDFDDLHVTGAQATDVRIEAKGREVLAFSVGTGGEPSAPRVLYRNQVWRVEEAFSQRLLHDEDAWLDRRVIPIGEHDVQSVTVALDGQDPYTIVRAEASADPWQLQTPIEGFRFDAAQASGLVNMMAGMQLERFEDVDPGAEKTGLDKGERFTVTSASGAPAQVTLVIGKAAADNERYARLEGRGDVFLLASSQADSIRRPQRSLRALNVMGPIDFDAVVEGGIERPGEKPMVFTRADGKWSLQTGKRVQKFDADPIKVNQRLRKMTLARAIGFAEGKEGRMAPGSGRMWLKTDDGQVHALTFGAKAKPNDTGTPAYWARGTADGAIYRISKPLYDDLMGAPSTLSKAAATAQRAMPPMGGEGFDSLPPDVRAKVQQQLAAQAQ